VRISALRHAQLPGTEPSGLGVRIGIRGRTISEVVPDDDSAVGTDELDATGLWVLPGFIDIHVHGALGLDFREGDPTANQRIASYHRANGTTTMLASVASLPPDRLKSAVSALAPLATDPTSPVQGVHLEGPFLANRFRGAHDPEVLREATEVELELLWRASAGTLRMITFAPELAHAATIVAFAEKHGIVAAIGHSAADYDQSLAAIAAGASHVTHTFNAMSQIDRRLPGPIPAALDSRTATLEIIPDGLHVHPAVVRMLLAAAGEDRVLGITDAVAATGLGDGSHSTASGPVDVRDGLVFLSGTETIAGSTLTMAAAFRNCVEMLSLTRESATWVTSRNAARLLGMDDRKGSVAARHDADLVVFDEECRLIQVIANGNLSLNR
jgi:N-acetylglucosamine-6-phosphate deacetylase